MLVLGIETSCDETGLALVESDAGVLAQALHSQIGMHRDYGGVVPELASRDHIVRVLPLLDQVLDQAQRRREQIDAIAVTIGPGLAGALLVGASIAYALGYALRRPVLAVHHLEGHLLSPLLASPAPSFPFVALLVSGGHTQLLRADNFGAYQLLGETVDDAAGEAFDKTAQLLGLGYPGGPAVSRLAQSGRPLARPLPRPMLKSGDLNFSFSGLKTAVLTAVRKLDELPAANGANVGGDLREQARADLARGFVEAVVEVLCTKSLAALDRTGLKTLVLAGGVGANVQLRARLAELSLQQGFALYFPPLALCTDNGAMIALAGLAQAAQAKSDRGPWAVGFAVRPRLPLSSRL